MTGEIPLASSFARQSFPCGLPFEVLYIVLLGDLTSMFFVSVRMHCLLLSWGLQKSIPKRLTWFCVWVQGICYLDCPCTVFLRTFSLWRWTCSMSLELFIFSVSLWFLLVSRCLLVVHWELKSMFLSVLTSRSDSWFYKSHMLCVFGSLQITPACNLPLRTVRAGGKMVIVNLQVI